MINRAMAGSAFPVFVLADDGIDLLAEHWADEIFTPR